MTKEPERIWCQTDTAGHLEDLLELGVKPVEEVTNAFTSYIREDCHLAAIAGAYEAAAAKHEELWRESDGYKAAVIRALTPADALAARDAHTARAVEAAVKAERERCMRVVSAARGGNIDQDFRTILHFIETGDSMEYNAEAHKYEHDSQRQDRLARAAILEGQQ